MSKQSFVVGKEIITNADDPTVEVVFENVEPLAPGPHVFQLIVEDDAGNLSEPVSVTVNVVRLTARIDAPPRVPLKQAFTVNGKESSAEGAKIASYHWTLLS